ncbi:hypothetical protein R3P38DRAFT_3224100 [Favolaschia claudopus]|uniref:RING-type domain-containing protein n=1 Tax=Favolaschia claudopus TaxID=2862362 RepID=A0AAV9ZWC1_9AGAR
MANCAYRPENRRCFLKLKWLSAYEVHVLACDNNQPNLYKDALRSRPKNQKIALRTTLLLILESTRRILRSSTKENLPLPAPSMDSSEPLLPANEIVVRSRPNIDSYARRMEQRILRRTQLATFQYGAPLAPARSLFGWRETRKQPLTFTDLWAWGEGPAEQEALKAHHMCGICLLVKSHPVSYTCGHSHCYVCIRMWLEYEWKCPVCMATMYRPPFRHWGEEDWIAGEYPEWKDRSVVDYSWRGLEFPEEPRVLVPATP